MYIEMYMHTWKKTYFQSRKSQTRLVFEKEKKRKNKKMRKQDQYMGRSISL